MPRTTSLDRVIATMRADLDAKKAEVMVLEKTLAYLEHQKDLAKQRKESA